METRTVTINGIDFRLALDAPSAISAFRQTVDRVKQEYKSGKEQLAKLKAGRTMMYIQAIDRDEVITFNGINYASLSIEVRSIIDRDTGEPYLYALVNAYRAGSFAASMTHNARKKAREMFEAEAVKAYNEHIEPMIADYRKEFPLVAMQALKDIQEEAQAAYAEISADPEVNPIEILIRVEESEEEDA